MDCPTILERAKYYTSFFTFAARFWQCEGKPASYWRPCPRHLLPLEAVRASFSLVDLIVIPIPIGADEIFSYCESCKSCFLIGRLSSFWQIRMVVSFQVFCDLGCCVKRTLNNGLSNHVWKCDPKLSFGQVSTEASEQLALDVSWKKNTFVYFHQSFCKICPSKK